MTDNPDTSGHARPITQLSPVTQNYVKTIWTAQEKSSEAVSTKMLSERMGVSASTVSEAIKKLADQGLVTHQRYGSVFLTEAGQRAALLMVRRHRLVETFLVSELGFAWDEVHDEAEVLEHAISETLLERMDKKLGFPNRDPHGDPIPQPDGSLPQQNLRRLSELSSGEHGIVARISDDDPAMLRYFDDLNINLDVQVRVHEKRNFAGTIAICINDNKHPVEIGTIAAQSIWITQDSE